MDERLSLFSVYSTRLIPAFRFMEGQLTMSFYHRHLHAVHTIERERPTNRLAVAIRSECGWDGRSVRGDLSKLFTKGSLKYFNRASANIKFNH